MPQIKQPDKQQSDDQQPSPKQRLYTVLAAIPPGKVVTYGQLARLAGMPRRARWVGQTLKQLPADSRLPWYKVINAQGRISFPPGSEAANRQAEKLRAEGIEVSQQYRINLQRYAFDADSGSGAAPA